MDAEITTDMIDWASDCMGMSGGRKCSAEAAQRYAERHYPGGLSGMAEDFGATTCMRGS